MRSRGAERSTQLDRDKSDGYVFPVRDLSGAGTSGQDAPPRSRTSDARNRPGGLLEFATLLAACGVGLLLRSLEFHTVFPENGDVLLGLDDAQFHARRALFSFVNFPAVLDFDWYLAFPDGAPAPVPPFFDWATAGVARLFGDDIHTLETVAAWVSPVVGSLLVWPAYAIGRSVATRNVGLGAAWLSAVLPSGILLTRLGNFDHHGAVALIAACWLASSLSCVGGSGWALLKRSAFQAGVITLMLFTWSGSLFYLALGVGAQLAGILLLHGSPDRLFGTAASLLAAAVPTALWLAVTDAPLGGSLSSQTLSWLHLIALLAIAIPTLLLALWEQRRPSADAKLRIGRLALLAGAIGLPLLALPALREPLVQGLFFLAERDDWAATNPEQLSLFHSSTAAASATVRLGLFGYLVPLLPLYLGWRTYRSGEREKLLILWFWLFALSLLLLSQVRYGTDFTVPGTVTLAMLLGELRQTLSHRLSAGLATACVALVVAAALVPSFRGIHQPSLTRALSGLSADSGTRTRLSSHEIAVDFGKRVREFTPDTGGFLEAGVRPDYGILVPSHLGHRFTYSARRPVPSNNLGPYLDGKKYQLAKSFYRSRWPGMALKTLEALEARYVMTVARNWKRLAFADHLHLRNESSVRGRPTTGRLRLAAASRTAQSLSKRPDGTTERTKEVPFKLFELVAGALLIVQAEPGSEVWAEIQVAPQNMRGMPYRTWARADASGVARVRVPYATHQQGAVATSERWRVQVGERELFYEVNEADVLMGRAVDTPSGSRAPQPGGDSASTH